MKGKGSKSKKAGPARKAAAKPSPASKTNRRQGPQRGAALASGIQRKLAVGQKDDSFEREADAIADRVTNDQPAPSISRIPATGLPSAQRETKEEPKEEKPKEAQAKTEPAEDDKKEMQKKSIQRQEEASKEEEPMQKLQRAEKEEKKEEKKEQKPKEEKAQAKAVQCEEQPAEEDKKDEAAQAKAIQPEQKPEREDKKKEAQKQDDEKSKKDEAAQAMPIQAKGAQDDSLSDAAEMAVRDRGAGEPLHPSVQRKVEASTGANMSDVRVHRGTPAERAAQGLGARAFTHGKDIWLGKGESPRDTRLMAHEAAHVVQQTGRGQNHAVQRTAGGVVTPPPGGAEIDRSAKKITIPEISLPSKGNKSTLPGPFHTRPPGTHPGDQRDIWKKKVNVGDGQINSKLPDSAAIPSPQGKKVFYLRLDTINSFIIGEKEDLKERFKLPNWTSGGKNIPMEVDHIQEWQLGGAHDETNFQLLDAETNENSGNAIRDQVRSRITNAVKPYVGDGPDKIWPTAPNSDSLRESWTVEFTRPASKALTIKGPNISWSRSKIESGAHLEPVNVLTASQIERLRVPLVGDSTKLVLFLSEGAGKPRQIPWKDGKPVRSGTVKNWEGIKGFDLTDVSYTPESGGNTITGDVYKENRAVFGGSVSIPIEPIAGLQYTGRVSTGSIRGHMAALFRKPSTGLKVMSPIEITDARFEEAGIITKGVVHPTLGLFKDDVTLDIELDGDDVTISKTFTKSDFDFPGPVAVTEAALTLSFGTRGLEVKGDVNFEIERVGKGVISGMGSIANGFAIEGKFEFDPELFNDAEAKIAVRYAQDKFSGEGMLKIGEGKVRGVKSASVQVSVDGDKWEATGDVEPNVPGVSSGKLSVKFDPAGGLEITGRLEFSNDIPRLKSGHIEAKVTKNDDGYQVEGSGAAELDIPGATAGLVAEYKNGLFKAEATLGYRNDWASGEIKAGVTNQPVGEDGQPVGEPGEQILPYGQGKVSLQFTRWLKGTAGIKLAPTGKLEVSGRVEVPNEVEVFPINPIEKTLFAPPPLDIPIFGVSVLGQHIGIFLSISGSLKAKASIGPGVLKNVAVDATFDPEDLSTARVTGTASFVVPAYAGIRVEIAGAIGAGIPIVSAKAGINIGGEIGVEGEARADAKVEWTPQTGINMEASLSVTAQPTFAFDISGFAKVTADLLFGSIELYGEKWEFGSWKFGSGLTVGAKVTARVVNNEFKIPSIDDIELIYPDIDPLEIAGNIIDQIV